MSLPAAACRFVVGGYPFRRALARSRDSASNHSNTYPKTLENVFRANLAHTIEDNQLTIMAKEKTFEELGRRRYLEALGLVGITGGLAGCIGGDGGDGGDGADGTDGGDGGDDTDGTDGGTTEQPQSVNLGFWAFGGPGPEDQWLKKKSKEWNEDNPNIQVEYTHQVWAKRYEKVASAAQADSLPSVIQGPAFLIPDYTEAGALQAINEGEFKSQVDEINKKYVTGVTDHVTVDGTQYGTPGPFMDVGPFIDINEAYLEEAGFDGPPRRWSEIPEYAREMQKLDGVEAGIALPVSGGTLVADNFIGFVYQNGGRYFDPDSLEATINGPGFVRALELYENLQKEGLLPAAQAEMGYVDAARMFLSKEAGMFISLSHAFTIFQALEVPDEAWRTGEGQIFTRAPLPESPSGNFAPLTTLKQLPWPQLLGAGADSDAKRSGAFEFMKWWTQPEQLAAWTYDTDAGVRGRLPTVKSAWENPNDLFTRQFGDLINLYEQDQLFADSAPFPSFNGLSQIKDLLIKQAIQPVILGQKDAQSALDGIQPDVQDVIDDKLK